MKKLQRLQWKVWFWWKWKFKQSIKDFFEWPEQRVLTEELLRQQIARLTTQVANLRWVVDQLEREFYEGTGKDGSEE